MMIVGFRGLPHVAVGDPVHLPPYTGPLHDGEAGWLPGDEAPFDRAVAEQAGRACSGELCKTKECNGDCFAKAYVEEWNGHYPDLTGDAAPFYLGSKRAKTERLKSPAKPRSRTRNRGTGTTRTSSGVPVPEAGTSSAGSGTTPSDGSGVPAGSGTGTGTPVPTAGTTGDKER